MTIAGTTHTTTVDSEGSWSVTFASSEILTGEYTETMTIVATDARGNSTTITDGLVVDTVQMLTLNAEVGGDLVINAAEQSAGATFTGTAQAGSTVVVTLGSVSHTVTADGDGNWAATFASGDIPTGTYDATLSATATDAAGNVETTSTTLHIDTDIAVSVDPGQAGGDDIISHAESTSDITLTGTAEVGSSVSVTVAGVTQAATVDASGNWSAVFAAGSIPGGEYDTTVTAVATDAAGNSATSTASIRVDTVAGDVALSPLPIEIDDVINAVERADGVDISGTATPGLTVTVTLGSASMDVVAAADGSWTTTFPASQIPEGTQKLDITASITDAVGNSKTVSDTVGLDTEVVNFSKSSQPIENDNVINAVEKSDGVSVSGTVEVGSTVTVQLGGAEIPATVDAHGNWTATFLPGAIPGGTYDADIVVKATDPAGNTATINDTVKVDTVASLSVNSNQTPDDIINAAEHASGVTLAGTSEPGSTVIVEFQGITRAATVDSAGNWSASFASSELPEGTYTASAKITATDPAGNTSSVSETFQVDTVVDTPDVDSVTFTNSNVRRIGTEDAQDSYQVNTLEAGGAIGTPSATISSDATFGTEFTFDRAVPDGTNLVVTRTDVAGNKASTMLVLEDDATSASTIGHAGASSFDIAALDLEYSDDSKLVLTEAQIKALSAGSDTLTIHGGTDDTVTVSGAVDTGTTQTIDGQTYNVYTIGNDGATLVIEQDVNVII